MFEEFSRGLPRYFYIGHLLPSAIAVLIVMTLFESTNLFTLLTEQRGSRNPIELVFVWGAVSIGLATLLVIGNFNIIRLYEGLSLLPAMAKEYMLDAEKFRYRELQNKLAELDKKRSADSSLNEEYGRLRYEFHLRFPSDRDDVRPTRLGNAIAAFERYPLTLYGMDAVTIWPWLQPFISDSIRDKIGYAKGLFDFFLNSALLILALTVVIDYRLVSMDVAWYAIVLASITGSIASYVMYLRSVTAATGWGQYIKASCDLYRLDLLASLGVNTQNKQIRPDEERNQWERIQWGTNFLYLQPDDRGSPDAEATAQEDQFVYVGSSGEKYHRASCSYVKNGRKKILLTVAQHDEITPCRVCRPDESE